MKLLSLSLAIVVALAACNKPADTTPALYKLLWLCEHEPETIKRTRWVVDVHGFLVNRLTGTWRTTTACADPLGLIDMDRRDWSDELLASRRRALPPA